MSRDRLIETIEELGKKLTDNAVAYRALGEAKAPVSMQVGKTRVDFKDSMRRQMVLRTREQLYRRIKELLAEINLLSEALVELDCASETKEV